jgi:hypothetical protein
VTKPFPVTGKDEKQMTQIIVDASDRLRMEPPPLSEEELQRREQETGEYSTAEVLAYLENTLATTE